MLALHGALDLAQQADDRRRRRAQITEKISASGDAFRGLNIDQQQWRCAHRRGTGAQHITHRHFNRHRADRADRECVRRRRHADRGTERDHAAGQPLDFERVAALEIVMHR